VPTCCLARILASHKDFFEQKSALEELLLARGHKCLFLPKFHCELNPIEMYWAYCKNLYRQVWKNSFLEVSYIYISIKLIIYRLNKYVLIRLMLALLILYGGLLIELFAL
jgi:transposase